MIADGSKWLESQRRRYLSVPVQYRVGGQGHPIACQATLAVGRWEAMNAAGQIVRMETRDFVISKDELHVTPKRGDTLTLIEGGVEAICTVVIPEGSEQAWRWADRSQAARRIHTQETARYENA
jgi:hypothetical protein